MGRLLYTVLLLLLGLTALGKEVANPFYPNVVETPGTLPSSIKVKGVNGEELDSSFFAEREKSFDKWNRYKKIMSSKYAQAMVRREADSAQKDKKKDVSDEQQAWKAYLSEKNSKKRIREWRGRLTNASATTVEEEQQTLQAALDEMAALHSVVKEWFLSLTKVSGSPEAIYLDLAQTALSHTTASFLDGASAAVDFPLLHVLTTPVILDPVTRTVVKKEVEEMQSIMATFLQSTKGSHMMAYEHYLTHLRQLSNIVRGSETVVEVAQRGAASWILPARVETKRQMTALEQEIVKNDESTDALRSTMKEQLKSKAKLRALQTQLVELNGAMTARPLKKQNFATALQLAVKYRLGAATGHAVLDSLPGPTPITRLTGLLPNEFYQVVLRPVATVVPFSALLVVLSTYGKYLLVYAIKRSRTLRRAAVHSCSLFELYVPLVIPFLVVYVNNVKGSVSPYLYISLLLPIQRVVFFLLLLACGTLNSMVCKRVQRYFIHWARLGERRRQ